MMISCGLVRDAHDLVWKTEKGHLGGGKAEERKNGSCLGRKAELKDNRRKQNKIHMRFFITDTKMKIKGMKY